MHGPCDKPFQLAPCRDLDLWPFQGQVCCRAGDHNSLNLLFLLGAFLFLNTVKSLYWFCTYTSENKCYNIMLLRVSSMLYIPKYDVIHYVIYFICLHYVRKAISPLFAWASSIENTHVLNIYPPAPFQWRRRILLCTCRWVSMLVSHSLCNE